MDSSFSQALKLSSMSSTTAMVIWGMVLFLIAITVVISLYFKKQIDLSKKVNASKITKESQSKGF